MEGVYLCICSNERDKSLNLELSGSGGYLLHALGNAGSMTITHGDENRNILSSVNARP